MNDATNGLVVHSYAVAGVREGLLPEHRVVPLPPPGEHRRRARLPSLAMNLAAACVGKERVPEDSAVLFGTALGSLTETAAFVENMLRLNEEMPRPRAFSSSVHNATASQVARKLGARGECQTFTHGELSFLHALFAAEQAADTPRSLVGAVDETTPYVERATRQYDMPSMDEGGAVLWCEPSSKSTDLGLATVHSLGMARPRDARQWIEAQLAATTVDTILWPTESRMRSTLGGESTVEFTGRHLSSPAVATALAIAGVTGEADVRWQASRSVAVVVEAPCGEVGLVRAERRT